MFGNLFAQLLRRPWHKLQSRRSARSIRRGVRLRGAGDVVGAYREFERALSIEPGSAQAHYEIGIIDVQAGRLDRGTEHLRQALALNPELLEAHIALGNAYKMMSDGPRAIASYRAALELNPDLVAGHYNLGVVLRILGRFEEASAHLRRALTAAPNFPEAIKEQTVCLMALGRFDEAEKLTAEAVARSPENGDLHACQGFVAQKRHRPHDALRCYETARRLGCVEENLDNNLGIVMQDLGRIPEAIAAYDRAIALHGDSRRAALPRYHRALAHLLLGDYAIGWADYEMRLVSEDRPRCGGDFPRWDGSSLAGRTIFVRREQGLGDEIMFASCLPEIIERSKLCVVECSPRLESLYRRSFPRAAVFAALPDLTLPAAVECLGVDCEIPVASLPQYLRRAREEFPVHKGYLAADARRVAYWRERLSHLGRGAVVGISWRGGTHQTRSPLRSIPLDLWAPIFRTQGVKFVSLQYGEVAAALRQLEVIDGAHVEHWQEAIDDYEETAALVCALDLVITVCTAVVHLGGALGAPVWVMTPYSPEWRYGFAGGTMPWYPSVSLFRQPAFAEWTPVIDHVAARLAGYVASRSVKGQHAHDL